MKTYESLKIEIADTDKYMIACDDMLQSYIGPRIAALDLGAHVGTRSLWLATEGRFRFVWAVECAIDSFVLLSKNIGKNDMADVVKPILAAVGGDSRLMTMRHAGCNMGQRSLCYREQAGPKWYGMITTSLESLVAAIGIDINFIKIDIEGAEYSLFADDNLNATTRGLSETSCLFVETHAPNEMFYDHEWLMQLGYDRYDPNKKLIENIKKCGFESIEKTAIGQIIATRKFCFKPKR